VRRCAGGALRHAAHATASGPVQGRTAHRRGFFIFIFYIFVFYKNIFSFSNLQKYTPAALLPGDRDLVAPLWGGRDFFAKNCIKI